MMRSKVFLIFLFVFCSFIAFSLSNEGKLWTEDIWKILLKVKYKYQKNAYIPEFDSNIKALDGKVITIQGYMYPLEEAPSHSFFMLSYYPIAICFFCGGAGPESVIEITGKKPIRYTTKLMKLRGTLKLNSSDPERLFFILLGAEEVQ